MLQALTIGACQFGPFLVLDLYACLGLFVCLKAHLESVPAGGKLLPVVDPEHPLLPVQPFSGGQRSVRNKIVRYSLFKYLYQNVRNTYIYQIQHWASVL